MKIVKINAWKKGLVFKNDNLVRVLNEGVYWLNLFAEVKEYDMARPFNAPLNLNILLKNEDFVNATILVEVKNNEIALQYENGLFKDVLTPGRYVFWKGLINYKFIVADLNAREMDVGIDKSLLSRKELLAFVRSYTVEPYEKAVMYVDGKLTKIIDPGTYYFWKNSTSIVITRADLRAIQMEIAGQEILTKDKAALRINFYAQYNIKDIVKAVVNNKEYDKQLYVLMQLALREFVGSLTLDELLEKKENVSSYVIETVSKKAEALGVTLNGCGIRDIILPGDMKDIMNQVLVAEKKAQANTIMRREETASTRSLLNTAKLMEDNAMLFKLKEMEYVEKIAEKINNISLSGGSQLVDQLKQIFVPAK
ncbi:peptidase [Sphingobacteriaceae bacterium]|nr:peptidase [Sphingobacteriaceae bacterium]